MSEKIPEGWKRVKLGDVAEIIGGFAFLSKHFGNYGIPVVKIKDIKPPYIDVRELQKVDTSFYAKKQLLKYLIRKNDFVVAMTGATIGKVGILKSDLELLINQRVAKIMPKNEVDKQFIYYSIINKNFQQFIKNNIDSNSAQANISALSIGRFPILLPPLPEQKAIASVLSSLDDKIDLLHRQNQTLEKMAETLFRRWFIENPEKHKWEEVRLGEVLENIESGSRPKGGIDPNLKTGIPSIGAENINGLGNFNYSKVKYIPYEYFLKMKRGIVRDCDVLIYKDGAYIGRKSMFGKGYPFDKICINEHVFILRTKERISQIFLYFLLDEEELRSLNTNSAQPGLNQTTIKNLPILLAPKDLINKFDNFVEPWINKIFFNGIQIRILKKLRDTLLPQLMSGKVRVRR